MKTIKRIPKAPTLWVLVTLFASFLVIQRVAADSSCTTYEANGWVCTFSQQCPRTHDWCVAGSSNCQPFFTPNYTHKKSAALYTCVKTGVPGSVNCYKCGVPYTSGCCQSPTTEPACGSQPCF
jgi:hypothetical protein